MTPVAVVSALVLASCTIASAHDAERITPYSCEAIVPAAQRTTVDPEIVAPWRALAAAPTADVSWLIRIHAATRRELGSLSTEERVRLQHQLLLVAQRLDDKRREYGSTTWDAGLQAVLELVRRTAPSAAELGDDARPAVTAILGANPIERATRSCGTGNSIHVQEHHGLLAFRPLRTATTRALVAQLVAFDTEGKPHVTPFVEGMELRIGDAMSSPACVIEARDDGTLHPAEHATLVEHGPFVMRAGAGVGCAGCHTGPDAMGARDVPPGELAAIDRARRAQIDRLASRAWRRLGASLPVR